MNEQVKNPGIFSRLISDTPNALFHQRSTCIEYLEIDSQGIKDQFLVLLIDACAIDIYRTANALVYKIKSLHI
jgi:hypothetical protein